MEQSEIGTCSAHAVIQHQPTNRGEEQETAEQYALPGQHTQTSTQLIVPMERDYKWKPACTHAATQAHHTERSDQWQPSPPNPHVTLRLNTNLIRDGAFRAINARSNVSLTMHDDGKWGISLKASTLATPTQHASFLRKHDTARC